MKRQAARDSPVSTDPTTEATRGPRRGVARSEFDRLYRSAVDDVLGFLTPRMQEEIALHNAGWSAGSTDFELYLRASVERYFRAYRHLAARPALETVCDVGGFWAAFPLTLHRLGYEVTTTETLRYYSSTFDELFEFVRTSGVEVVDFDPFATDPASPGAFDFVTVMAVLEHYPHSLATFMGNLDRLLAPAGLAYLETPNIALWNKRMELLLGRTPITPVREIYRSRVPFTGHHHEFTMSELEELARLGGLEPLVREWFNYSPDNRIDRKLARRHPLRWFMFRFHPATRELAAVLCRRAPNPES
jgi:2-polyprenyl-3-methyl-5-hydroxy-6-metoxy-1,4-benzoquinol methylase